ncbi:ABC transporter substrate-binding protein [Flavobacterium sp. ZT3R18]|uniref:ABC transporter substrate-binding protein n=1 Tax=Flavobacterium sp. ZT3R18 TaxID=2594429 RepID=UPI00163D832B|nr:ABC transporter substrate-binding protein [Flavobacterium sp. ZT3R18]
MLPKIGVLLPQSKQFKTLDRDFIRGLKLPSLEVSYRIESISLGADERLIIDKMQKLHYQEEVSIIIGFFGHHKLSDVFEYASNHDILLIASDLGANLPYQLPTLKGVYCNSYGLHESSYLLGKFLQQREYKSIVSSSSYYDAGYGFLDALTQAFEENKTSFSGHYITPFLPRETETQLMLEDIESYKPEVICAFHSGLYTQEHTRFLNENKLLEKYPYYLSAFCFDSELENEANKDHLFVVGSWLGNENCSTTTSEGATNFEFITNYHENHSELPTVFSLLGYESGLIIKALLENTPQNTPTPLLIATMNRLHVAGPRGTIRFDPETQRTNFDHYIYTVCKSDTDLPCLIKTETLTNTGNFIKKIINMPAPLKAGGWQNAYLCH